MSRTWRMALGFLISLVVAVLLFAGLAALGLWAFSMLFEGSGHPPMPNAPTWLYVTVFLVFCPLTAIGIGVLSGRVAYRWLGR